MIDSHCHLTYPQLASQLPLVMARAAEAGIRGMITIGTSLADARNAVELCRKMDNVRCVIGIHPHHSEEAADGDVAAIGELQKDSHVLALGEMGLDYHYDFSPRPRQKEIFVAQLELARSLGRPIVIHCREAMDDCLGILKSFATVPAVFHCFTGTPEEARRILDAGYLLGFTGAITFKKAEALREVVGFVPGDRMLIETDAPYLAPEPVRKQKVNEPALLVHTACAIANIRGISLEELDVLTTANVVRFFGWP